MISKTSRQARSDYRRLRSFDSSLISVSFDNKSFLEKSIDDLAIFEDCLKDG
jgi:hypothetical protein